MRRVDQDIQGSKKKLKRREKKWSSALSGTVPLQCGELCLQHHMPHDHHLDTPHVSSILYWLPMDNSLLKVYIKLPINKMGETNREDAVT